MSTYSGFSDSPDAIIKEGQEITIKFVRNNDGTGTVSWNIPPPSNGCSADTQAYDGIVVTIAGKPANYKSTSPTNAVMYNSDTSADPDIHMGDKLDGALIIGAFYHDRKTVSLKVNGIDPTQFYYVSGYAVDNVGTYHREGVHAYSLPSGTSEKITQNYNAFQSISILAHNNSKIIDSTPTGLNPSLSYPLHVIIDGKDETIIINGADAQTYGLMIDTINREFKKITGNPYLGPLPPNADKYYLDKLNKKLFQWDGFKNVENNVLFSKFDPNVPINGTYWYNPVTDVMNLYGGAWTSQVVIKFPSDPTTPACGTIWVDNSATTPSNYIAYEFNGDYWCTMCLYAQERNPSLSPILDCNTYWYDSINSVFNRWNPDTEQFKESLVVISDFDPDTLGVGSFWLNEADGKIYRFSIGVWTLEPNVRYDKPNAANTITRTKAGMYWYNSVAQRLLKRNIDNTAWDNVPFTMYPTDPMIATSCEQWWNRTTDILYSYDEKNLQWVIVNNFYQQAMDPSAPPELPSCVVWYKPSTGELNYLLGNSCALRDYILSPFDPMHPPIGAIWHNITTDVFLVWNGTNWDVIDPIISNYDPYILNIGYKWYDVDNDKLNNWNGTGWDILHYSDVPLVPTIGTEWYNTLEDELYEWNGSQWVVKQSIVFVSLQYQVSKDINTNGRPYLFFQYNNPGCGHTFKIVEDSNGILAKLRDSVIYNDPVDGSDGVDSGSMYNQLGVGNDGSPDERRKLHDTLRTLLGSIGVSVELSKVNIDQAINNALLMFRKYSSYAYTRNFFFLDSKPNQQTYILANKCVGFNKISNVRTIYRMRAGWIRTGLAGNELFGIAALQQLYTVGTFDMLSFALMTSYMKELEQIFATRIMFQWVETTRELRLHQRIMENERLLLDVTIERTEQDIITNRASAMWIQNWALMECKKMLSQVRGKYLALPGPNGSTNLNAQDLASQADTERSALMEELLDPAMGNLEDVGLAAHFTIG